MSDLNLLGSIKLNSADSLLHNRGKLLSIITSLDQDPTRTIPFIARLSDAMRWYVQWGQQSTLTLHHQPAQRPQQRQDRLVFSLQCEGLTKPLPQHIQRNGSPQDQTLSHETRLMFALPKQSPPDELARLAHNFMQPSREELFAAVQAEQAKSEKLVLNILPKKIAETLKNGQTSSGLIYDFHPSTTILFSDEAGFTSLTKELHPESLVRMINQLFSEFDNLCEQHGIEKIKTIGDAYMAVCGVPSAVENHAERTCRMALDMLRIHTDMMRSQDINLRIRIGLHSGPVVAGVIGRKKYAYDLWGDAVNVASRMESTGMQDCIQISEATRNLLPEHFQVESRGSVEVKGQGSMSTYFLRSAGENPTSAYER
jgi:class 3 adenylate cyclase